MMLTGCLLLVVAPTFLHLPMIQVQVLTANAELRIHEHFKRHLVNIGSFRYYAISFLLMVIFCIQTLALYRVVAYICRCILGYIYYSYYVYIWMPAYVSCSAVQLTFELSLACVDLRCYIYYVYA